MIFTILHKYLRRLLVTLMSGEMQWGISCFVYCIHVGIRLKYKWYQWRFFAVVYLFHHFFLRFTFRECFVFLYILRTQRLRNTSDVTACTSNYLTSEIKQWYRIQVIKVISDRIM